MLLTRSPDSVGVGKCDHIFRVCPQYGPTTTVERNFLSGADSQGGIDPNEQLDLSLQEVRFQLLRVGLARDRVHFGSAVQRLDLEDI